MQPRPAGQERAGDERGLEPDAVRHLRRRQPGNGADEGMATDAVNVVEGMPARVLAIWTRGAEDAIERKDRRIANCDGPQRAIAPFEPAAVILPVLAKSAIERQ